MLLTKTTELAIQSLLYLAQQPDGYLANPSEIAERLQESQTYISKVLRQMAKSGMIRSRRGMAGGFELVRSPETITLLDIVEVSQGTIPGNYCTEVPPEHLHKTCGYHQAMFDLRAAIREVLSEWSLARILAVPSRVLTTPGCMLECVRLNDNGPGSGKKIPPSHT